MTLIYRFGGLNIRQVTFSSERIDYCKVHILWRCLGGSGEEVENWHVDRLWTASWSQPPRLERRHQDEF